jgi:phage terminase large subunit-like protein
MCMAPRLPRPAETPPAAPDWTAEQLNLSPEVHWYLLDRGLGLPEPWQVPLYKTPEAGEINRAAVFDPERVDKVLRTFGALQHTKGDFAGLPLDPSVWQTAYIIAPVFGWVEKRSDGSWRRCVRECWVEVSRKNGKSTLIGGLGLYMTCADGEAGAEAVAAATTKDQASYVFGPVRQLAKGSPLVSPYVRVVGNTILHNATMSTFKVVAAVGESLHGANLHFYCADEVHVHKTPDLIEAIETGTGSRSQPLGVLITTADDGKPDTVYVRKRDRVCKLARRVFTDPSTYGVIWAAAESEDDAKEKGLDLFSEEAQRRANPGYGVSPTPEYLAGRALRASQSPAELSSYVRLHLGIRTRQRTAYLNLDHWDRNAGIVERERLAGRVGYGGLDLASTADFTAWCVLFPDAAGGFDALWRLWLPEGAYDALVKRTSKDAEVWRREGRFTVTDGEVVDDEIVERDIKRDLDFFKIKEVGYDPWNASAITNHLGSAGATMVQTRQGYATMSPALKAVKNTIMSGTAQAPKLRHGGHPVVRWMVSNLAVAMDESGNVKPDRKRSIDKIDGVAALNNAMSRALAAPPVRQSVYSKRGLVVV